jgi:pyruvate dehydrogenase E1 component beta subunit
MTDLDKEFGRERVIDCPVSEAATTGMSVGVSLFGYRPIIVHPRMDFMLLATDQIVNQAAKWRHMLGGRPGPAVVIRAIINRGGEQGAQHSQALHAWYSHIPGLRVVMPASALDARDLLVASTLCDDPVIYIDDRWLYELSEEDKPLAEIDLRTQGPRVVRDGSDITIAGAGYSVHLALEAAKALAAKKISAEVVDVRILNPFDPAPIVSSVKKTGRLLAVDGGWSTCGFAAEILASTAERLNPDDWRASARRITIADAPAPSTRSLEAIYYPTVDTLVKTAVDMAGAR